MATDIRYQEAMNVSKAMRKKQKELEEKYDIECMTVATMETYLSSFDTPIEDALTDKEDIGNVNHCITLMNYLDINEWKAQRNSNNILIDDYNRVVDEYKIFHDEAKTYIKTLLALLDNANERYNKKAKEYDDITKQYREMQEKYVREIKERERKEFRRNRSRYRSWENET